jgi:hypothetical protein
MRRPDHQQISLFDTSAAPGDLRLESMRWPPAERFPLNTRGRKVWDPVLADLQGSRNPLIIAGYAAIDYLIDMAARVTPGDGQLRVLVGSEPFSRQRVSYATRGRDLPSEVEEYWLKRGISLRLSGQIVATLGLIRAGRLQARFLGSSYTRLHAKIYVGDSGVTLGSSNFTQAGLTRQLEANVRFTPKDKERFGEAVAIAENYWQAGESYDEALLALLEKLLRVVTWEEALARASAELLEGDWVRDYLKAQRYMGDLPLWPSQEQGIAEAMWVLENVGSVLVADATGSGKTRLGAHLIRAVVDRIWSHGRARKAPAIVIAPPAVKPNWEQAAREAGVSVGIESHGSLSRVTGRAHSGVADAVRRAQVLAVDEAHNFLNRESQRTRAILANMADHTILFTATPINRSAADLLRLADMLGADNLADSTLEALASLLRRQTLDRTLSPAELGVLRRELQRFTVRRTKTALNALVDEAPEAYLDAAGRQCRYPEHRAQIYRLNETEVDRDLARQIRAAAETLYGVAQIVSDLEMPEVLSREGWTEAKYLDSRLHGAQRLSGYLMMATLRSSVAALVEHVAGTEAALQRFGLATGAKSKATGNILEKLGRIAGQPPANHLTVPVPDWLTDPEAHRRACEHDIAVYQQVLLLAGQLSDRREAAKVELLRTLAGRHTMLLAFDSRPISLALLRQRLAEADPDLNVIVATGEQQAARRAVTDHLRPGAATGRLIALCSDAMSEGVNLQAAAAVVHLDRPSVVRIAEQRVGRVDRMDSPNAVIEAWWPQDAPELALRADERFIERYETVESLLGSNMPLPEELATPSSEPVSAEAGIQEFEEQRRREPWDGLRDAFAPVRELIGGPEALVPRTVYDHYRTVATQVLSRVGLVKADHPWALVCFAGSSIGAPRWVLVTNTAEPPVTDLVDIAAGLRERLGPATENVAMSEAGVRWLDRVLTLVQDRELDLLPRRKRRALTEMRLILSSYLEEAARDPDLEQRLSRLIKLLDGEDRRDCYDWDTVAETWLDLIRPVWYQRLRRGSKKGLLQLKDIRKDLQEGPRRLPLPTILSAFETLPTLSPVDERVAACILGVQG